MWGIPTRRRSQGTREGQRPTLPRGGQVPANPAIRHNGHEFVVHDQEVEDMLQSIRMRLQSMQPGQSQDRTRDLRYGQKFRIGELVWVKIPPIQSHELPLQIDFWPGYIEDHSCRSAPDQRTVHHSQRGDDRTDEYEVELLGVGQTCSILEENLAPWQAHKLSPELQNALSEAVPQIRVTARLSEFSRFHPIQVPDEQLIFSIPRTFEHASAPLALAMNISRRICKSILLTDEWEEKTTAINGSVEKRYQGCWFGPERFWSRDYIRLRCTRTELDELATRLGSHARLALPTTDAINRSLLLQLKHISLVNDKPTLVGHIFEIAPLDKCINIDDPESEPGKRLLIV